MNWHRDGRSFQPELQAVLDRDDGQLILRAPTVGSWRGAPRPGSLVSPGSDLGELEILGVLHRLVAPPQAVGLVVEDPDRSPVVPVAVGYGHPLVRLDPEAAMAAGEEVLRSAQAGPTGLVFASPLSGRFYARPSPDKPAFVQVGDEIKTGQTVALLEVMKTFNRITYGGAGMPDRARVKSIVPADEADLDAGDPILELEAV